MPGPPVALLRRLFREHGRAHWTAYAAAALLMATGAAATATSTYLLAPVVNHMVDAVDLRTLRKLAFAVFGLFVLRGAATYGYLILLSRTGNRIVAAVQARVFDNLLRQDLLFFQDRHSSEFMTRLALAANGVRDTIQVVIMSVGRDLLTLIGLIVVMFVQDPIMATLALSVMPVAALSLGRVIRRVRRFARSSFDGSTRIMQVMQETVQGVRIVKSFNLEDEMRARMAASIEEVERSANRMSAGMAVSSPLSDVLGGLAISMVIFYGSWRVSATHADPGSLFSFIAALLIAYDPAKRLARLNLEIQTGLVGARLIYDVLDRPAAEAPVKGRPPLAVGPGRIVLERVKFGYRPDELVLDGLDFIAEPDKTTALVGPSGGGKSTIISLIQRFYEPASGLISIDGQAIGAVDLCSLRGKIGFVAQDVFLFRGTIRDNIALGRLEATDAEIMEAARKANAYEFIMGFARGFETNVGEQGAQLSGGQRQRIAIARAILKNAPIILLDEPTAALDSESEREVQHALDDLRENRTTVVVAHRLQTIVNADRICVVEHGRICESGTHAELIARRGAYHTFFAAQFGEATTVVTPELQARRARPTPKGA